MNGKTLNPSRYTGTLSKSELDILDNYSNIQLRIWGGRGGAGSATRADLASAKSKNILPAYILLAELEVYFFSYPSGVGIGVTTCSKPK